MAVALVGYNYPSYHDDILFSNTVLRLVESH
jgi:hypothetical protein